MEGIENIKEFLYKNKLSADCFDFDLAVNDFLCEMQLGLACQNSSLAMIPSYIIPNSEIKYDINYAVVDIGGSYVRSAVSKFDKNKGVVIDELNTSRIPTRDKEMSYKEFYQKIAKCMTNSLNKSNSIGMCFSYHVDMDESIDGKLIGFSKELKVKDAQGKYVGRSLLEAIRGTDKTERKIAVINDSVATLLGGITASKSNYAGYIGFIFGTGVNACYLEKCKNIKKIIGYNKESCMIVNTESGNFDKLSYGEIDKQLILSTSDSSSHILEKMISGKYIGELCLRAIIKATQIGLIKSSLGSENYKLFSTKQVNMFLSGEKNDLFSCFDEEKDCLKAKNIISSIIERSAKLSAVVLSALIYKNIDEYRHKTVGIIAEGSTFYLLNEYKSILSKYLKEFLLKYNVKFAIIKGNNLNLIGATKAIMQVDN